MVTMGLRRPIAVKKVRYLSMSRFQHGRLHSVFNWLRISKSRSPPGVNASELRAHAARPRVDDRGAERIRKVGHYFRISPDATISITRITVSDTDPRSNGHPAPETSHLVVDLLPVVMAIWSSWAI